MRRAADHAQAAWAQLDFADLIGSWTDTVRPAAVAAVEQGQQQAALLAAPYVAGTLQQQGVASAPLGVLLVGALAGRSAGGLPLSMLLDYAWAYLRRALDLGVPAAGARAFGLSKLLTYTSTEIGDAGRVGVQIVTALEPKLVGYVRLVHLPACGRCIQLAGRLYRYSSGFLRHPRCDCQMKPVTGTQWRRDYRGQDPQALFEKMTPVEQAKAFGAREAKTIRAGGDIHRVVNARRKGSLYIAGGYEYTHEASTTRGVGRQLGQLRKQPRYRYRSSGAARPTPAQLVDAARNRSELIRQLRQFGYIY